MLNNIQKFIHSLALSAVVFGAGFNNAHAAANLSISNIPLFLGNSVQPNIFFLLDDSGSMDWEILMNAHWSTQSYDSDSQRAGSFFSSDVNALDTAGRPRIFGMSTGNYQAFTYLYNEFRPPHAYNHNCAGFAEAEACNNATASTVSIDWRIRSSGVNVTFYNPDTNYIPWNGSCGTASTDATCTNADFRNARYNPKNGEPGYALTRDLATNGDTEGGAFVYDVWIDDSGFTGTRPRRGENFNDTGVAAGVAAAPNGLADLWDTHIRVQIDATSATVSRITYDPRTTAEGSRGLNETTQVLGTISGAACYDVLGSNANVLAIHTQGATPNIAGLNGAGCRTIAQAQTSIANWYQYSRKRMYGAKSAMTAVIDAQPRFRYGITQFENQSLFVEVPAVGVLDNASHNLDLKHRIYSQNQEATGTDLLEGLEMVGEYFKGNRSGTLDPIKHACQKNFEIVFTDGFWNVSRTIGDIDNDGKADVGADAARKYYMTDLSPLLEDNVIPDKGSEADLDPDGDGFTWQHLVSFTVAFGVQGQMIDADGDRWPDVDASGNPWSTPGTPDSNGNWGDARGGGTSPAKIDDLWHMAWNTNGIYATAASPEEMLEKLLDALGDIDRRLGSASAVALNSGTLNANTRIYQAQFKSTDWSGELESIPVKPPVEINPLDGSELPIPATCTVFQEIGSVCDSEWKAGEELEAMLYSGRNVYSRNTDTNAVVTFKTLADLGAAQQTALRTHPDTLVVEAESRGQDRLDFILGKNSFAAPDDFRKRNLGNVGVKKLGDIISSSPTFVGEPASLLPDSLEASKYSIFADANKKRRKMIYVGANDGMLHGFDAADGKERFAYIPGSLVTKLNQLTSPDYDKEHTYFVDGSPQTFDIYSGGWKTVLSSSAGAGGQLVFGLDVTNPDAFKALWEFTDADDADMGYSMGDVKFARMNNGKWVVIFGNGFNNTEADGAVSATGNSAIYVVDANDGTLLKKFDTKIGTADDPTGGARPNGIAEVTAVDLDGDLDVDFLYAGDLFGNLWKVDVSSGSASSWDFAYESGSEPKAFYTAKDASGTVQPITAGVSVKKHPENGKQTLVLFGTGQYFEVGDDTVGPTSQVQSFYSIWDDGIAAGAAPYDRTNLLEHKVLDQVDLDGVTVPRLMEDFRVTSSDAVSTFQMDWGTCGTCKAHKGWYMDLLYVSSNPDYPTEYGERVVRKPILRDNRVIYVTLIPDLDACGFGGSAWIMEVDADTGSRLPESPFDVDSDGDIDPDDFLLLNGDETIVSGVRSKEGIVSTPGILNNPEGGEFKYFSGTSGEVDVVRESSEEGGLKRQSYRQLR